MENNCNNKNPLVRSGSNQNDRMLPALDPAFAKVDERTLGDFLLFARKYSKYIRHYDSNNKLAGNWSPFWESDISAVLVELATFPMDNVRDFYLSLRNYLIDQSGKVLTPSVNANLLRHFKLFFHLPVLLIERITRQYSLLPVNHELRKQLSLLFEREGKDAIEALHGYHQGALNKIINFDNLPISVGTFLPANNNIDLPDFVKSYLLDQAVFLNTSIQLPYLPAPIKWDQVVATTNSLPFEEEALVNGQVFDALNYSLFIQTFDQLLQLMQEAKQLATNYFESSLNAYDCHTPHYGLWLVFLKLYQYNQDHLNTFTERHLVFYFQKVLQLYPKKPKGDRTHLLFELNNNISAHLLKKGTSFKAGKDEQGRPVYYHLLQDLLVNKGKVSALKSVFVPEDGFPIALQQSNTLDGIEEPLPDGQPDWKPFGNTLKGLMPEARLGFAIADTKLFLKDGDRKIRLNFQAPTGANVNAKFSASRKTGRRNFGKVSTEKESYFERVRTTTADIFSDFDFFYTAEKEWIQIPLSKLSYDSSLKVLSISIDIDQDPIVGFNLKTHKDDVHFDDFENAIPILKGVLKSNYKSWKSTKLRLYSIQTGANNVRDFTVQNKDGIMDTSKPYPLLGARPVLWSSFILGSRQAFSHPLAKFSLHLVYESEYSNTNYYKKIFGNNFDLLLNYLEKGRWEGATAVNQKYFFLENNKSQRSIDFSDEIVNYEPRFISTKNKPYTTKEQSGYLKFSTDEDFGHTAYPDAKSLALIKIAGGDNSVSVPDEPYTPVVTDLSFDYETKAVTPQCFYSLLPFGFEKVETSYRMVPSLINQGELYIRIEDLQAPQNINLLFQVANGTADPLANEASLRWHFLAKKDEEDIWLEIGDGTDQGKFLIDDKTNNFSSSGIVGITCPKTKTNFNGMPKGFHWIRISVDENADALNNLISINAQAGVAVFEDNDNDQSFLEEPLSAETISKFQISNAAIKKVNQPYEAFGGKGKEQWLQYYLRISERLRHKNRAIQIWDYEHLVLEHFPNIYKVKCLNHTKVCTVENGLQPGHVTLVIVPKMSASKLGQYQPFADKKSLTEVEQFIRNRISPFVRLQLVQPKLEAIQLEFKVAFNNNIADISFYKQTLSDAISQFLAPWAFDSGKEVSFGGKWYKTDFINFVEEQPYVHYVKEFFMYQKSDLDILDMNWNKIDIEIAIPTSQRTIFVPHLAHIVTNIHSNDLGQINQEIMDIC